MVLVILTRKKKLSHQWLHHFFSQLAYSMKAGPVRTTRGAISPGKTAIPGGALLYTILLTPQLTADIAV